LPRKKKVRKNIQLTCSEVWREFVNYTEDDLSPERRSEIELHLRTCHHCTAIYEGSKNVVHLLGEHGAIDLPAGFGARLRRLVMRATK
jgi:anti-sigma factor RsiW